MKKLSLVFFVASIFASNVFAQVYKWVDANGKVTYGDAPNRVGTSKVDTSSVKLTPEQIANGNRLRVQTAKLKQQQAISQKISLPTTNAYHCVTADGKESYSSTPCPKTSDVIVPVNGTDQYGNFISGAGMLAQPVQQHIVKQSQACEAATAQRNANYGKRKRPDFPTAEEQAEDQNVIALCN